jgi:hypothetical protein
MLLHYFLGTAVIYIDESSIYLESCPLYFIYFAHLCHMYTDIPVSTFRRE